MIAHSWYKLLSQGLDKREIATFRRFTASTPAVWL